MLSQLVLGLVRLLGRSLVAVLWTVGFTLVLVGVVHRYAPGWLESVAARNPTWSPAFRTDYVNWIYSAYFYEALAIGLLGGLMIYSWMRNCVRFRHSW